jgi:hypothetical protein
VLSKLVTLGCYNRVAKLFCLSITYISRAEILYFGYAYLCGWIYMADTLLSSLALNYSRWMLVTIVLWEDHPQKFTFVALRLGGMITYGWTKTGDSLVASPYQKVIWPTFVFIKISRLCMHALMVATTSLIKFGRLNIIMLSSCLHIDDQQGSSPTIEPIWHGTY